MEQFPPNERLQQVSPSLKETTATERENIFAKANKKDEQMDPLFSPVPLRGVDDPAKWDEAWFANYE